MKPKRRIFLETAICWNVSWVACVGLAAKALPDLHKGAIVLIGGTIGFLGHKSILDYFYPPQED